MNFELKKRQGIAVWVYTLRQLKNLKRFGYIHYVSNRMKYVMMYVDQEDVEMKVEQLSKLHYVRKVEVSRRRDIDMTFENALPGKSRTETKDGHSTYEPYAEKTYSF